MRVIYFILFLIPSVGYGQVSRNIKADSLPIVVRTKLAEKYSSYKIVSLSEVRGAKQSCTYKVELQRKSTLLELELDSAATVLKKSKSKVYTFDHSLDPSAPHKSSPYEGTNHQH